MAKHQRRRVNVPPILVAVCFDKFSRRKFFQSLLFQFTILVRSYRFNIFVRVIIIPRIDNTFVSMKHMRAFYFATCKFDIIGYRRMIRLSLWRTIRYLRKRTLLDLVFNPIQCSASFIKEKLEETFSIIPK